MNFSEIKNKLSDVFIFGLVFCIVSIFALTPVALADYQEECVNEGCSRGELASLYESYTSECLVEGCSNEEMYETAGGPSSVCPMFSAFEADGFPVDPASNQQFGC